ncbi:hypothetical protein JNB_12863 [Janibacter sp. HTCC2649]|uniref:hypothetical protein n=1 Tax=Janibacter sp. HTCC2649 TaxID=313589 RepID=UPI00006718E9|nr:hypothetical protein [Janibacter sp. HTCC2649]EAP97855.1 hypothetical protein JNB_12863 [Janibacter sp. HTCC2649]
MPGHELFDTVTLDRFNDVLLTKAPRPHVLLDVAEQRNDIAQRLELAAARGLVGTPVFKDRPPPRRTVTLEPDQTAYRNQGGRGTCYAFATVAAMEAAYRRDHGVVLDLSEDFLFHLNKVAELFDFYLGGSPAHENNTSYEGFQGSSDIVAKVARCAIPDEAAAPYRSDVELETIRTSDPAIGTLDWTTSTQDQFDRFEFDERYIPTPARYAARYRVRSLQFLPSASRENVMAVIDAGHEVITDIPGHCFLIIGYDLTTEEWIVKNSWGSPGPERWSMATTPLLGGTYITAMEPPDAARDLEATWIGRWHMNHDGWQGQLVLRRTQNFRAADGDFTKVGDYFFNGGPARQVNGRTEDDGRQLHFWIADQAGRITPGMQSGQEFRAYQFTREDGLAAGVTWWNGCPFGVTMARAAIPSPLRSAGWQGDWEMNHDGWHGRLSITSTGPWAGTYTPDGGAPLALRDFVAPDGYQLSFSIPFADDNIQRFTLLNHTQESGRFSGTTVWAGMTFGVQGRRARPQWGRVKDLNRVRIPRIG